MARSGDHSAPREHRHAGELCRPVDVLAYWRSVELFSPQPIPKSRDARVRDFDVQHLVEGVLPWHDDRLLGDERLRASRTLQHDVFVGVYSLDAALQSYAAPCATPTRARTAIRREPATERWRHSRWRMTAI
jgi:hypothetical protein